MRTLILHIGLEKTGTTSLQHFCSDNYALLRRHGVLYPKNNPGFSYYNHAKFAAAYLSSLQKDLALTRSHAPRQDAVAALLKDIHRHKAPLIIISSEHFSSRFDRQAVKQLSRDLGQFETRIAVTIRPHRARFFSSYSTYILGGGQLPLANYAEHMLAPGKIDFRLAQMLTVWLDVFGIEKIDLFDYARQSNIVAAYLLKYKPMMLKNCPELSYRDNAGLVPSAVEALRLGNKAIADRQAKRSNANRYAWLQRRFFQRKLMREIAAVVPARTDDRWRLSEQHLQQLDEIAATDRQWLKETFDFAMIEPAASPDLEVDASQALLPTQTSNLLANALVETTVRGWWGISEALVSAATRFGRGQQSPEVEVGSADPSS